MLVQVFKLQSQGHASPELVSLAVGPLRVVNRYSIFMGNGFRFHTRERVLGKKTQNSGVLVRGDDSDPMKEYYGVLEHIYELSYVGNKKVYLFKCHWWDMARLGRGYKIDKYGFTSVNARCSLKTNEPFVLASQAEQVFYIDDIVDKDWLVVVKTSPRDLFNMPQTYDDRDDDNELLCNEEAYQQMEIESNIQPNNEVDHVIVAALHRDDIEPMSVRHANEQLHTNTRIGDEAENFINDNDIDDVVSEETEEELLDDNSIDDID